MAQSDQTFAVIATRDSERVREEIEKLPENAYYELKDDTWFVSYEGTSRMLAEHLGIRGGTSGSGLVILVGSYSGRASGDVWEWLKAKWRSDV